MRQVLSDDEPDATVVVAPGSGFKSGDLSDDKHVGYPPKNLTKTSTEEVGCLCIPSVPIASP